GSAIDGTTTKAKVPYAHLEILKATAPDAVVAWREGEEADVGKVPAEEAMYPAVTIPPGVAEGAEGVGAAPPDATSDGGMRGLGGGEGGRREAPRRGGAVPGGDDPTRGGGGRGAGARHPVGRVPRWRYRGAVGTRGDGAYRRTPPPPIAHPRCGDLPRTDRHRPGQPQEQPGTVRPPTAPTRPLQTEYLRQTRHPVPPVAGGPFRRQRPARRGPAARHG